MARENTVKIFRYTGAVCIKHVVMASFFLLFIQAFFSNILNCTYMYLLRKCVNKPNFFYFPTISVQIYSMLSREAV